MMDAHAEDVLSDALTLLGCETVEDTEHVQYGPLRLTVAPKEGKANTLLADHLFSPALVLAELIELGLPIAGRRKLGAGCALPSLLAATMHPPPSLIVATDYPDDGILGNLRANVDGNRAHYRSPCQVHCVGYAWGADPAPLLDLARRVNGALKGYDIVVMSDLLHFDSSHDALVRALTTLLAKSTDARVYVAAGKYTAPHVCDHFLNSSAEAGLTWEEGTDASNDGRPSETWKGSAMVGGLDNAQLGTRKRMCRWWTGRWGSGVLSKRI